MLNTIAVKVIPEQNSFSNVRYRRFTIPFQEF